MTESHLQKANKAYKNKDFNAALENYRKAQEDSPNLKELLDVNIRIVSKLIQDANGVSQVSIRQGYDNFMLRGLKPCANYAIVINLTSLSDHLNKWLKTINFEHDLFLLGNHSFDKFDYSNYTKSITVTGDSDKYGHANLFLKLVNSNVFDDYSFILWYDLSGCNINEIEISQNIPGLPAVIDDYGLISNSLNDLTQLPDNSQLISTLKTALPRLGVKYPSEEIVVPCGQAIWINTLLLRGISVALTQEDVSKVGKEIGLGRNVVLSLLSILSYESDLSVSTNKIIGEPEFAKVEKKLQLSTLAFYLPQFHPIPENDKWWGQGFTEWTNVTKGRQLFRSHYQPRVPTELGFYDLRLKDNQIKQAKLASEFGIHGFCYYYYWFDGIKLLNSPIEQMFVNKDIDTSFCVCWANENWSRNWDGQNRHVLMNQTYTLESNISLIRELIPMMKDPRWVRHNGKPVMMVYRISIIPNWIETAEAWRNECRNSGLGEIHLCAVRFGLENLDGWPEDFGIDSYVIFPPHESNKKDIKNDVLDLHKDFNGEIFDYKAVVDGDIERFKDGYSWPVHRGSMMGWDNTARRLTDARIFHGATPYAFRSWIKRILNQEAERNCDSLLFINAWNEWAEGTYLEPDQRWGRSYLKAYASAVRSCVRFSPKIFDAAKVKPADEILNKYALELHPSDVNAKYVYKEGGKKINPKWPTVMLCAHVAGHQLFGGERSLLDVLRAFSILNINVIVTLPSGGNENYIKELQRHSAGVYVFHYIQWRNNRSAFTYLTSIFSYIIARHAVDVVHANTIMLLEPLEAAIRTGRKKVIHARELISLDDHLRKQIGLDVSEIIRGVFSRSDWVVGNSLMTNQLFYRPNKSFHVPNAVSVDEFVMNNKYGSSLKFGIVSSNIPKKGVSDFVEVARLCAKLAPRAKFVIVGPHNHQIECWGKEVISGARPDNLIFAGYLESPRKAMSQFNILLSLSHFAESFGRTIAEGMAASRPVIAYDWGAVSELVKDNENGFLVPYMDIDAVVGAVVKFCEKDSLVLDMGRFAHEFIEQHFSQENLQKALSFAYSSIFDNQDSIFARDLIGAAPSAVSIVVPIYNASLEVENCINSILKHTNLEINKLILVNDCSTELNVSKVLQKYDGMHNILIINNPVNLGYTKSINIGISQAGKSDVVLLNSDTVVTPTWLEGLISAAYSRARVATVTAMSDNAGAFSFPKFNQYCPRPEHLSNDEYALLMIQGARNCLPPEVPTGSGFCMYIRHSFIDQYGSFDEVAFPRGYGEENDFCMRALKSGWVNLISPWSFVYHVRSASFKGEKEKLVKSGVDVVTKRYPDYSTLVRNAFQSELMLKLRNSTSIY